MRNTYVIAAVIALGLVAPVAFFAGQYVSQNDERNVSPTLNQEGGNGLDALPGGGGASTNSFSWGCSQPANVYGGVRVEGNLDRLVDLQAPGKHFKEAELQGHEEWIMVETYVVPPDWDGLASGKRIHSPLVGGGEPGIMKGDASSPKLFIAISRGDYAKEAETRALNAYLKLDSIIEPDSATSFTAMDELDPSVGGRIWVNFSLNFMKIEMRGSEQSTYSTYIELPKSWLAPSLTMDKASPMLYLSLGANPMVPGTGDNATFDMDVSMVHDSSIDIVFEPFTHMEDVGFTYGHIEDVSLTYMHMEDISFTFTHLEDISFTYGHVREGGGDQTENK